MAVPFRTKWDCPTIHAQTVGCLAAPPVRPPRKNLPKSVDRAGCPMAVVNCVAVAARRSASSPHGLPTPAFGAEDGGRQSLAIESNSASESCTQAGSREYMVLFVIVRLHAGGGPSLRSA